VVPHLLHYARWCGSGLISYPLYLWHWPLLSFGRIMKRDELSVGLRITLILASVVLAWATYALVEKPVRFAPHAHKKAAELCVLMLAVGLAGFVTYRTDGLPSRAASDSAKQIARQTDWPPSSPPSNFSASW
jgi:hypothetical protein